MNKKLSIKTVTRDSIEHGYAKDKNEAWTTIMNQVGSAFGDRLRASGVKDLEIDGAAELVICAKTDCLAVKFRGKWFETYMNTELLYADLNPFTFVLVEDPEVISIYSAIQNTNRNKEPLAMSYAGLTPRKELLN